MKKKKRLNHNNSYKIQYKHEYTNLKKDKRKKKGNKGKSMERKVKQLLPNLKRRIHKQSKVLAKYTVILIIFIGLIEFTPYTLKNFKEKFHNKNKELGGLGK